MDGHEHDESAEDARHKEADVRRSSSSSPFPPSDNLSDLDRALSDEDLFKDDEEDFHQPQSVHRGRADSLLLPQPNASDDESSEEDE